MLLRHRGKYHRSRRVAREVGQGQVQPCFPESYVCQASLGFQSSPWVKVVPRKLAKILNQPTALQEALGRTLLGLKMQTILPETAPTPRKLSGSWLGSRSFNVPHVKVSIRRLLSQTRETAVGTGIWTTQAQV